MTDKAMALFGGDNLPATDRQAGALRALGAARRNAGDKAFMKFAKGDGWVFGAEKIEVDENELWAVNPNTFMIGVIGWEDGEVVDEEMYPITAGKRVNHDELEPIKKGEGNGWSDQISVELKHMGDGTEVIFKTSSNGGLKAMSLLADGCGDRMEANPDTPVPVCRLTSTSYRHKKYGKIHEPVFEIDHWVDMEGHAEGASSPRRNLAG